MDALRWMARGLAAVLLAFGAFMALGYALSRKETPAHVGVFVVLLCIAAPSWSAHRLLLWAAPSRKAPAGLGAASTLAVAACLLSVLGLGSGAVLLCLLAGAAAWGLRHRAGPRLPALPGLGALWERAGARVRPQPANPLVQLLVLLFVELPEALAGRSR